MEGKLRRVEHEVVELNGYEKSIEEAVEKISGFRQSIDHTRGLISRLKQSRHKLRNYQYKRRMGIEEKKKKILAIDHGITYIEAGLEHGQISKAERKLALIALGENWKLLDKFESERDLMVDALAQTRQREEKINISIERAESRLYDDIDSLAFYEAKLDEFKKKREALLERVIKEEDD